MSQAEQGREVLLAWQRECRGRKPDGGPANIRQASARRMGCECKIKYRTEAEARVVLAALCRKSGVYGKVYRCQFCDGFHVSRGEARFERPPKRHEGDDAGVY